MGPTDRTMEGLSRPVQDHLARPRNAGSLDGRDPRVGTGLAGTPEGGDLVRVQIRVGDGGVIEAVRFKAFGCSASIASGSLLTEWAAGRTLIEAVRIRSADLARALELPKAKIHCSVLAEGALRAAILDFQAKPEAAANRVAPETATGS